MHSLRLLCPSPEDSVRMAAEIGRKLIIEKATLPHKAWLDWLSDNTDIPPRSAQRYMRLARIAEDPGLADAWASIADLTQREAIARSVGLRPLSARQLHCHSDL